MGFGQHALAASLMAALLLGCGEDSTDSGDEPAAGGAPSECPEAAPERSDATAVAQALPLRIVAGDAPLVMGETVSTPSGQYWLSLFKMFLADPVLVRESGDRVAAQLAREDDSPAPYGLLLLDADVPTPAVKLLAPPGTYTELELGVGVPAACNGGDPTVRQAPLDADSDMYWTWGAQYMFLRIEGKAEVDGAWQSFVHHVGFDESYRRVSIAGEVTVGSAQGPALIVDVDRILATERTNPALHSEADIVIADNLVENDALRLEP